MLHLSLCLILLGSALSEHTYFSESFPDEKSIDRWIVSKAKGDQQGKFIISAGKAVIDKEDDLGLMTSEDARHYGIVRKIHPPFSNKDKTTVIQFSVKYDKQVDCGGAYIKLLGSDINPESFDGETPYKIMFGPDICGTTTRKVHVIFNYKGSNHLITKDIRCKDDTHITHLYTLILTPDNKYTVLIDNQEVEGGSLEEDWHMLPPKFIPDPSAVKPSDWEDEASIPDPNAKKPDDWDKPEKIPDPKATKPEDWDEEIDGDWTAPMIDNPEYKGPWSAPLIDNPKYKGKWEAPKIKNPDYVHDPNLYHYDDIGYVGFELWQVASGSIFDNILITDSPEFAKSEGERVWRKRHDAERELEKKENEKVISEKPDAEEEDEEEKEADKEPVTEKPEPSTEKPEEEVHEEL